MQTELNFAQLSTFDKVKTHSNTALQRNIIKKILESHPEGITDLEIELLTGFKRSSITARRNEIDVVIIKGYAKIVDKWGDRLNTMWGIKNGFR